MPRHKRIDIPGAIHHVITRGLNRQDIFRDDADRIEFLKRLEKGLTLTGCRCYAWSLMSNHFHLLIRTGVSSLSDLMRKVLTGYAIYFNRRHNRHGYLYQNRYKSVLCQEDVYFLELVRYIHLNPVRAGVIKDLNGLDQYPWTGHSVLAGRKKRAWQDKSEVLRRFHEKASISAQQYREFVEDGFSMKKRPELTGGGLKRSAGGWEGVRNLQQFGELWRGDERILGDGDFVNQVLKKAEETLSEKESLKRLGWDLERLVCEVCRILAIEQRDLRKKGRGNNISMAKGLICFWGYHKLGINGNELARFLNISRPAVSQAIQRGEKFAKQNNLNLLN